MGSAIHKAMSVYWKGDRDEILGAVEAERLLRGEWIDGTAFEVETYIKILHDTLKACWKWLPKGIPHADVVMVEESLGEDGHTTPDLVTKEGPDAELVVTDWKYSHHVLAENIRYRLEGSERNHQFLQYIASVSERLDTPVKRFRKVVIVGTPKPTVKAVEFEVVGEAMLAWANQAANKWHEMKRMRANPILVYRREEGCKPFGDKWPCEMFEACWTCHGDRKKMENFYIKGGQQ